MEKVNHIKSLLEEERVFDTYKRAAIDSDYRKEMKISLEEVKRYFARHDSTTS